MRKLHDVVLRHSVILAFQSGTQVQTVCSKEHLHASTAHWNRLQIWENLFTEIIADKLTMRLLHFLRTLIEHNAITLHLRQDAVIKDTDAVFQLPVHLIGYLSYQLTGLIGSQFLAISSTSHRLMFRYTHLIKFLQVGRVDGNEIDSVIE